MLSWEIEGVVGSEVLLSSCFEGVAIFLHNSQPQSDFRPDRENKLI